MLTKFVSLLDIVQLVELLKILHGIYQKQLQHSCQQAPFPPERGLQPETIYYVIIHDLTRLQKESHSLHEHHQHPGCHLYQVDYQCCPDQDQ